MRKLFIIILSLLIALGTLSIPAIASTEASDVTEYGLKWELDTHGTLTISGNGDIGNFFLTSSSHWLLYKDDIVNVVLEEGITRIGDFAFYGCTSLVNISIPTTIISIGRDILYNTALYNDSNNWVSGVLYIDDYLIATNSNIEPNYVIKSGIKVIADYAFNFCEEITNVIIPNSVNLIGNYAFNSCSNLINITVGNGVSKIGDNAFNECMSLINIDVDNNNQYFCSENGVLFNKDKNVLIYYPTGKKDTSYTVPNTVVNINDNAFKWCSDLTSITMPNSIKSIGTHAFYDTGYYNDEKNWDDGVLYIGNYLIKANNTNDVYKVKSETIVVADYAFHMCDSLISIIFPNDGCLEIIGKYAFANCNSITSVTIPESVTKIEENAFSGCNKINTITIGTGVKTIGDNAFQSSVFPFPSIHYTGSLLQWRQIEIGTGNNPIKYGSMNYMSEVINGTWGNLDWELDNEGTLIISGEGDMLAFSTTVQSAFSTYHITELNSDSYAYTDTGWFEYSEHISKVIIKEGVTSIAEGAFCGCDNLKSVTIPVSVKQISSSVFTESENLLEIVFLGSKSEWEQISENIKFSDKVKITYHVFLGDANRDGYVDNLDAAVVLKYDAGIINSIDESTADVNNDGSADNLDAAIILKYDAGLIESF